MSSGGFEPTSMRSIPDFKPGKPENRKKPKRGGVSKMTPFREKMIIALCENMDSWSFTSWLGGPPPWNDLGRDLRRGLRRGLGIKSQGIVRTIAS